ncbi:MAG TPA: hypothetical protein VIZ65_10975 [Cellvibrionaceae bacterium]
MKRVKNEDVLDGNPNRLTRKQHILSRGYLEGFYGANRKVQLIKKDSEEVLDRSASNGIFWALRAWDQRMEQFFMKKIEDDFFAEISSNNSFERRNHLAITLYHRLWWLRHDYGNASFENLKIEGISESAITKDQEEKAEKRGFMSIREGGIVPSKYVISADIRLELLRLEEEYHRNPIFWALIDSVDGEYIVADCYKGLRYIPISPTKAFAADISVDEVIFERKLAALNRHSIDCSTHFYFARDFSSCPIA